MLETTNHTTGGDRPQKVIVRTELRAFLFLFLLFSSPLPTVHPTPDRPPPPYTLFQGGGYGGGVWGGANMLHLVQYSGICHTPLLLSLQLSRSSPCLRFQSLPSASGGRPTTEPCSQSAVLILVWLM